MKKADVIIGKTYIAKVSGKLVPVKIVAISPYGGWIGRNERTGRVVRIRGAARLRHEYAPAPARPDLGLAMPPTDLTSPRKNPIERGITLAYMRAWRQRQHNAGRDASFTAFWRAHGLCAGCHGRGEANSGRQADPACTECGGTGVMIQRQQ